MGGSGALLLCKHVRVRRVTKDVLVPMLPSTRCSIGLTLLAFAVGAPARADKPAAKAALTFDDLPVHGAVPAGRTRLELTKLTEICR
jgi:hypothetical protein